MEVIGGGGDGDATSDDFAADGDEGFVGVDPRLDEKKFESEKEKGRLEKGFGMGGADERVDPV